VAFRPCFATGLALSGREGRKSTKLGRSIQEEKNKHNFVFSERFIVQTGESVKK
jgi:hypothetical protein